LRTPFRGGDENTVRTTTAAATLAAMATKVNGDGRKPPTAATNLIGEFYAAIGTPWERGVADRGLSQPAEVLV
jgi:hypothetical protein